MRNDRLFQMVHLLLQRQLLTAPALARILEVSVRTVYRDVQTLSIAGIPIYASAGRNGGISLMPGYTLDKTVLSGEEQEQLLFAVQSLKAADQEVQPLLTKLGNVFQKPATNWIEVDFSRWGLQQVDRVKFEQLKQSILQHRMIHLVYCGTSGATSEREIKPVKLLYKSKSWYLYAFCMTAKDFRLFKINRILELTLLEQSFSDDFASTTSIEEDSPPLFSTVPVLLRFASEAAFRLYDEFDRASVEKQPDGSFLVMVQFPLDGWVYGYLLSFGTQVDILQPPELKDAVSQWAKKIAQHHKS